MTKRFSFLAFTLLAAGSLSACSMISKGKASTSDTGGGGGDGPVFAGTMAEARTFEVGDTMSAPVECHGSGYAKVAAPAGAALKMEVVVTAPGESCVSVAWLNENGGATGGLMEEVCTNESPATFDVTGMENISFISVGEGGKCVGASVAVTIK